MTGVTGDKHAPNAVLCGDLDPQIPEAYMVELRAKLESGCCMQETEKVVILALSIARNRRMKKEPFANIHPTEELPVPLQFRLQHPVGRALRVPFFQAVVQLARTKHREYHSLVEVGAAAIDAHLLAHNRARSVAAD